MGELHFNHVYFIGIGGIGMSGIAEILLALGYRVSGSDLKPSNVTDRLQKKGATIFIGQQASNITTEIDLVVRSTAIREENVEWQQAMTLNIPILHRSNMLAMLMQDKRAICVAGAHGKTTTSSMIALILELAGKDPTIAVGGEISQISSNAKYGSSDLLVAEADESDGSFLNLHPWMTVITNIEEDHLDHYLDLEEIKKAFVQFLQLPGADGVAVLNMDCVETSKMIPEVKGKVITYGFHENAQVRAEHWQQEAEDNYADIYAAGVFLGKLHLRVPGRHNISNALAAITAGLEVGLDFKQISKALLEFTGAKRRFQLLGEINGVKIVDDYAHHPTEIAATIQAARDAHSGRLIVVFQPHRYSRTKFLAEKFAACFHLADRVILTDVYPAGEALAEGAESNVILEKMDPTIEGEIIHLEMLNAYLLDIVQENDLVLMMGAGNIWQNAKKLVEDLQREKQIF